MNLELTTAQTDRAAGVLLAMACGDALGAGYEFGPPLGADVVVVMAGGGSFGWAPGEWTDDTSMAIAIARSARRVATFAPNGPRTRSPHGGPAGPPGPRTSGSRPATSWPQLSARPGGAVMATPTRPS